MYIVYKIIYKITNEICYVGKTKQKLQMRFNEHANVKTDLPITRFINEKGINNFLIEPIKTDLTEKEAIDLEKKMIRKLSRTNKLYNTQLYQDINTDNIHLNMKATNMQPIYCITTNEKFKSLNEACLRYKIASSSLHAALNNSNRSAGFDEDDNPLYWKYINKQVESKNMPIIYQVYVISQFINNKWIPIYVGSTKQTLQRRLQHHMCRSVSAIYNVLHQFPKEHFKIEAIKKFDNKQDAVKYEEKKTLELQKKYKLYNYYAGNKNISESSKQAQIQTLLKTSQTQLINNQSHVSICPCIWIEKNKIFNSLQDAKRELNITSTKIKSACENPFSIKGMNFQFIKNNNLNTDIIEMKNYALYAIFVDNQVFITYPTKYANIHLINKLDESNGINIKLLYDNIQSDNKKIVLLYNNISKLEDVEKIKQQYMTVINCYMNRNNNSIDHMIPKKSEILCTTTNEIFESSRQAIDKYKVSSTQLKRVLKGYRPSVKSKILDKELHFEYTDPNKKAVYTGYFNIYYILYKNDPVEVVYTAKDPLEILPHLKCQKTTALYKKMQILDYKDFSVQLVQKDIDTEEKANFIKLLHINLLYALGHNLFSDI